MATARPPARGTSTRTPAQTFALAFGAVYLLIGILGFAFTGFDNFATYSPDELIIFPVNPLHNIVHLAIGAAWVASAARHDSAKAANLGIGVVYLLVAALGLLEVEFVAELLTLNNGEAAAPSATDPDNFLHLVSGALGVFFGTAGAGDRDLADRRTTA